MGSISDLQKLLRQREERIVELERILKARDDQLGELRTKLDKFQSVLHTSNSLVNIGKGPRNKRAVGISAEPQSQKSVKELADVKFKKHPKSKT